MKRFLLALLISPAALGATYNVALPGGGVLTVNGLPYVNPGITNSASVVWGVDGTGLLYATATGTNSSIVYVEGAAVAGPNFGLSTEVDPAVTAGTNITFSLVDGSITTNKIDATFYGLLTATSGAGLGTNIFVNNILLQPAKITNSATVTWATNLNGDIEATSIAAGTGDVVGPATSTADTLAIYYSTTGKLLTNAPAISATNVQTITAAVAAYEPLNANKYQATNATLTEVSTSGSTGTGAFVRADSPTVSGTWAFDTFTASNLTATTISGNGSGITNLNGTEIRSGTVADARIDTAIARTNAPTLHSPTLLTPSLGVATATSLTLGATNLATALAEKAPLASPAITGTPTVNGTNLMAEVDGKAALNSPAFTGSPTVPTAAAGTSNTVAASTKYVDDAVAAAPGGGAAKSKTSFYAETEFMSSSAIAMTYAGVPWSGTAVASGTSVPAAGDSEDAGAVTPTSSTSANSGYHYLTHATAFALGEGWNSYLRWTPLTTNAGTFSRIGWQDSTTVSLPTDGFMLIRSNNIVSGYTFVASAVNNTTTSYSIETNTTYSVSLSVQSATNAQFTIYNSDGTTVLWTETLTNAIPTGTTGHGMFSYSTNTTASALDTFRFMNVSKASVAR